MPEIKMITSDMDGTLVPLRSPTLAEGLADTIRAVVKKGIVFSINTGRQYGFVRPMVSELLDDIYILCQNGSTIYYKDKLIYSSGIERSLAYEIADYMETLPDSEHIASTAKAYYYLGNHPNHEMMKRISKMECMRCIDNIRDIEEDILQLTMYDFTDIRRRKPAFDKVFGGRINANVGSDLCMDITAGDKGTGLKTLCEILHIQPEQVAAFGDNQNDLAMLRYAGMPYVMAQANAEMLAEFPMHCDSVYAFLKTLL